MTSARPSAFRLPAELVRKSRPDLIARDEQQFADIDDSVERSLEETARRLDRTTRAKASTGQESVDRDLEARRLAARLHTLQRFSLDLCLGRIRPADDEEPRYIGRLGLADDDGRQLLIDWRAPAAEPFFAATHADPRGLMSRRRYRWAGGRVSDYWDEVFTPDGQEDDAALDDQSAFIASLSAARTPRMRDVLTTIQADQDAIIRASSRGALVVDGGPGTGKTVVALHRAAYLLYADPALAPGRGGVLFVGPHEAYLAYVDDVLPRLGEETVQIRTLRDLVPEGARAGSEPEPVAELKASAQWSSAFRRAVRLFERPPADALRVETPWADLPLGTDDWAEAFDSAESGLSHNEARDQVWESLVELLARRHDRDVPRSEARRALAENDALVRAFARSWPILDPVGLVATLWSDAQFLRRVAPWLTDAERAMLVRADPRAWTLSDLPLLDLARSLIGDPGVPELARRQEAALASRRAQMDRVIDDLIAADDGDLLLMSMLRTADVQNSLIDDREIPDAERDPLAGPFAHIIVDEAQELTDAEWQMLVRRCPSRSFTIVGDRAQARRGFTDGWADRLARVGLRDVRVSRLTINYRTPAEIMASAEPVIRSAIPDANVPVSIRKSGIPVERRPRADRDPVLDEWVAAHPDGVACVIGDPAFAGAPRIRSLSAVDAKGLEFDLVVLVAPDSWGDGITATVDRYVAMTRATERLVVLSE
ncbi:RNA polymerase recycling motor ATPase HelR [Microbacterium sp. cx-59]|uniref:RNA polymerase recycling motor ATPase HelR n=1 Tax=Microbacterium sp. cx-59 TaxID=2891207 RepID=UPI001E2BA91F|nr:RNA polymerase recycling motor ATPase HelR [Microbacterium sp. cx-59]MCC4907512.1 AAA family ATPase [Microbacterium sp. cx-59]